MWLYRLTYNLCVDHLRKQKRQATVPLETEDADGDTKVIELRSTAPGPEEAVEKAEDKRRIMEAVNRLPDKYRAVLLMYCLEDMKYDEIAQALDISQGTVKSRLSRARRMVAEIISSPPGTITDFKRQNNTEGGEGR